MKKTFIISVKMQNEAGWYVGTVHEIEGSAKEGIVGEEEEAFGFIYDETDPTHTGIEYSEVNTCFKKNTVTFVCKDRTGETFVIFIKTLVYMVKTAISKNNKNVGGLIFFNSEAFFELFFIDLDKMKADEGGKIWQKFSV